MSHTPTPWHCSHLVGQPANEGWALLYRTSDGASSVTRRIDTKGMFQQDDAEFILKACNAHEALVAGLKAMVGHYGYSNPALQNDAEKLARAALAVAGAL